MSVIETEGLTRRFGEDIVAVRDLTLDVQDGEVFGFLGHNGAGKTTTVRLLSGILAPTTGTLRVLGLDPLEDGPALRRHTGVLTETPSLEERLTARETLHVYADLYDVDARDVRRRTDRLLEEFELEDRAEEYVGGFSKGMRQRLALARTLIHEPRLLFLDEPTSGLDPVGRRAVHDLVLRLSRTGGRTVFLCTHDLVEAQRLCDRVGVMEEGRLVAMGTPEELARELQQGIQLDIALAEAPPETFEHPDLPKMSNLAWDAETGLATVWLPTEASIPKLITALVHTGARIYRVMPRESTLEDVYFALHDHSRAEERP
jgi:ABC-2 type transport system ATP-binding protein